MFRIKSNVIFTFLPPKKLNKQSRKKNSTGKSSIKAKLIIAQIEQINKPKQGNIKNGLHPNLSKSEPAIKEYMIAGTAPNHC